MNYRVNRLQAVGILLLGTAKAAGAAETVNYGVQPTMSPIWIARALGLLKPIEQKYGMDVEFHSFDYGPPENDAMASNQLQMASAGMGPAIVGVSRLPATLLALTVFGQSAILVPKDSPVKAIADLKGKKVAFTGVGAQQYPMLLRALATAGLKDTDITLFKTIGPEVPTLLQQKSVDAGITYDPFVSAALVGGYARLLMTADQIMPIIHGHYPGNGEYARNDFIQRRPEVVQALLEANIRAILFIQKNPARAATIWAKETGLPENYLLYSVRNGISSYNRDVTPYKDGMDTYANFLRQGNLLEAADVPKIDISFAQKAIAATK